ncbi:MAG: hypothetical protein R3192_13210 [Woeseiaceae bacterium]|nr:hypothetical protein [Woeseiaceae bacterium]
MIFNSAKIIVPIAAAMLVCGCAVSSGGGGAGQSAAAYECAAGYIMTCDVTSSGRISDGRYGYKNKHLRGRKNCRCEPEESLEALEGPTLPQDSR